MYEEGIFKKLIAFVALIRRLNIEQEDKIFILHLNVHASMHKKIILKPLSIKHIRQTVI